MLLRLTWLGPGTRGRLRRLAFVRHADHSTKSSTYTIQFHFHRALCFDSFPFYADTRHRHHIAPAVFVGRSIFTTYFPFDADTLTTNRNGFEAANGQNEKQKEARKNIYGKIHLSRAVAMCRRNAIFHSFAIWSEVRERARSRPRRRWHMAFFALALPPLPLSLCALQSASLLFILVYCEPSTAECAVRQMDLWATKLFVGRTGNRRGRTQKYYRKNAHVDVCTVSFPLFRLLVWNAIVIDGAAAAGENSVVNVILCVESVMFGAVAATGDFANGTTNENMLIYSFLKYEMRTMTRGNRIICTSSKWKQQLMAQPVGFDSNASMPFSNRNMNLNTMRQNENWHIDRTIHIQTFKGN